MKKVENKTSATLIPPESFLKTVEPEKRREDAKILLGLFRRMTGLKAVMWGPSIIGFGRYHYQYESGREGESMLTGFSPRKANLVLYVMPGYRFQEMEEKLSCLGKHKLGKSCLYINKLADVDLTVLEEIVLDGLRYMRDNYVIEDE
jgi:hypothetical protein